MQIIEKSINELIPYDKNPRKNKEAVDYVANSIKEFGFKVPIVIDKNNVIVTGHTRLLGAKKLGLDKVPCVVAEDLTDEQIKAFRLADNKVSEFSKWDNTLLDLELNDIELDMTDFGFDLFEEDDEEEEIEAEIEFTEVLGEEHNYIVLYFDNEVDWLQAETLLDLKKVQNLSTRKDGKISEGMKTFGVSRVIKGRKAIDMIRGDNYEDNN